MGVALTHKNGMSVIRIEGRFVFQARQEFMHARENALSGNGHEIQVDLSGTDYIDSAALGMLLILRERALAAGKSISLAACGGTVEKVLRLANFDKLFAPQA